MNAPRRAVIAVVLGLMTALTFAATASTAHTTTAAVRASHHRCHGHRATITGNRHRNTIIGTKHRDIIWAGAGRDRVIARAGNDLICGGKGSDTLDGNKGHDPIYGGPGKDWCVAWHPREHRLHHNCEVHVGLPPPHHKPQKLNRAAVVKTATTPSSSTSSKVGAECGGSTCDAGLATCDTTQFSYSDTNDVAPSAYTRDGGYLAVAVVLWGKTTSGGFASAGTIPWTTYKVPPGNWLLMPNPSGLQIDQSLAGITGYLVAYFSYSKDGVNWSTTQFAIETSYLFAAGGYGSGLNTGECDL